jgi:flagellar biosynthesis/type III secretory pathway M-ring protein FliF/YscJ
VPKKLLLMIGGMVLASVLLAVGLIVFLLPPGVFEPTTAERAEEQEAAQAEQEATGNEGDQAEDAPGGGDTVDADSDAAEPGGEDTGEVRQEELDDQADEDADAPAPGG